MGESESRIISGLQIARDTALRSDYRNPAEYHEFVKKVGRENLAIQVADVLERYAPINLTSRHKPAVLDMAAGTGIISAELIKRGYAVTAADINQPMLDLLRQQNPEISTVIADFNKPLSFKDKSFKAATTVWANRYLTKEGLLLLLREMQRILEAGGIFVWPIFPTEIGLWKLNAGLTQPTTTPALSKLAQAAGFREVEVDRSHFIKNLLHLRITPLGLASNPYYIIAKK